jgi:hypothetical protein
LWPLSCWQCQKEIWRLMKWNLHTRWKNIYQMHLHFKFNLELWWPPSHWTQRIHQWSIHKFENNKHWAITKYEKYAIWKHSFFQSLNNITFNPKDKFNYSFSIKIFVIVHHQICGYIFVNNIAWVLKLGFATMF